jgi:hypothetical protein
METIREIPWWVPFSIEKVAASLSWDRTFLKKVRRSKYRRSERAYVPFRCAQCGACRDLNVGQLKCRIRRGTFTGVCQRCCRLIRLSSSTGARHARWQGGRRIHRAGYVFLHMDALPCKDREVARFNKSGYVMEHRLVMGRRLGRPLEVWESGKRFTTETVTRQTTGPRTSSSAVSEEVPRIRPVRPSKILSCGQDKSK